MMHVFGLIVIVGSVFFNAGARAEDASEARVLSLMRAKSLAELRRAAALEDELREKSAGCRTQLRARSLPFFCFRVLALEERMGLLRPRQAERTRTWLAGLCAERARTESSLAVLRAAAIDPSAADACGKAVSERIADLEYALSEERPLEVFDARSHAPD